MSPGVVLKCIEPLRSDWSLLRVDQWHHAINLPVVVISTADFQVLFRLLPPLRPPAEMMEFGCNIRAYPSYRRTSECLYMTNEVKTEEENYPYTAALHIKTVGIEGVWKRFPKQMMQYPMGQPRTRGDTA